VRADPRGHATDVECHERSRFGDASEQQEEPNAQEANEGAVGAIAGEGRVGRLEQATGHREITRRERHLAPRREDAGAHGVRPRQAALCAFQELERSPIFPELRHGHATERERPCVVTLADEAQRRQGIEALEMPRCG
jgi:hypothetical protein